MIYIWPSLDFTIFTQSHMPFKIKTTRLFLNSTLVQRKTTQLLFELEFCKLLAINKVRKVEHKYFERPTICKTLTKKLENIEVWAKCLQNNKFLKNTKVGHGDLKTFWTKTYWLLQVFPENTRFSFFVWSHVLEFLQHLHELVAFLPTFVGRNGWTFLLRK